VTQGFNTLGSKAEMGKITPKKTKTNKQTNRTTEFLVQKDSFQQKMPKSQFRMS